MNCHCFFESSWQKMEISPRIPTFFPTHYPRLGDGQGTLRKSVKTFWFIKNWTTSKCFADDVNVWYREEGPHPGLQSTVSASDHTPLLRRNLCLEYQRILDWSPAPGVVIESQSTSNSLTVIASVHRETCKSPKNKDEANQDPRVDASAQLWPSQPRLVPERIFEGPKILKRCLSPASQKGK